MGGSDEDAVANVLVALSAEQKLALHEGKPEKPPAMKKKPTSSISKRTTHKEHKFPVEPRIIQVVKKPKSFMNHSYRDFSNVPPSVDYEAPRSIAEMSFSEKVHDILSSEECKNWISWCPHGRAFRILVPKRLEQGGILKKYFGHNRYSSFLRQLNNYGFKHVTRGVDRNCYYHECMLRNMPHLCRYMPEPRDARRLMPDPDNEPDFASLQKLFPLPDDKPAVIHQPAVPAVASLPVKQAPRTATGVARLASEVDWLAAAALRQGPPAKLARLHNALVSAGQQPPATLASMVTAVHPLDVARAQVGVLQQELAIKRAVEQKRKAEAAALALLLNGGVAPGLGRF